MILIPAENGFNKTNLPWLTFTLILLNILAFSLLQTNDHKLYREAVQIYDSNNLLVLEKPIFQNHAERHRPELYYQIKDGLISDQELRDIILFDKTFTQYLSNSQVVTSDWKSQRSEITEIIQDTSTYQYSYYPSEPSWFTALSHMFMHGDIFHLLGNMMFLFLFGYNLEVLLGRGKMLLAYFLSGLAAVTYFAYTTDDKFIPLVGASGAISGLMGGFAGFYGLKRIRYLIWIFVYFNYVRLPAILVLIYWLLNELIQASNDDGVAYMAHFGGLVAGFIFVFVMKLLSKSSAKKKTVTPDLAGVSSNIASNSDVSLSNPKIGLEFIAHSELTQKARMAVKELDFDLAKDYYQQLINIEPNNSVHYQALYNLEKSNPQSRAYTELVKTLVENAKTNKSMEPLADTAIQDLKAHLGNFNPLPINTLINYCQSCLTRKKPKLIRSVINHLVKHASDSEELPNILLHFAFAIEKEGDWDTKHKVLTYLSKHCGSSFAGQEAQRELELNH